MVMLYYITAELCFLSRSASADVLQMYYGACSALQEGTSRPLRAGTSLVDGKTAPANWHDSILTAT